MASQEREVLKATLEGLEETLVKRAGLEARIDPENFLAELEALELVIDLRRKLK
jgi:hypothetical protein